MTPALSSGPEQLFAARLAADPAGPLVTFYDDATGERAELSAKSLGNWVAKTHFLLHDELGAGPGDRAFVRLPVHWLAAPVLLGCWYAGLEVVADPAGASVAFGDADSLLAALPSPERLDGAFAVSLLSMARPSTPPPGMADYASSVRPMPDSWHTVRAQAGPDDPALAGQSRAEVAEAARQAAAELGLAPGGRLLWSAPWAGPRDWIAALLAPLAVGGSVVLVRNPDPASAAARATAEKVSVSH
ncbi:TIGR03089 family protein [Jatrophihabitans sp.]|uniref:TIGR03089 family protein n=1 Tax=Jatrophihabitans sp. TaxID=1932789 RepID=UPI002C5BC69A|nr:TIGR03089 family protein [Jatrophihabitans sp.]